MKRRVALSGMRWLVLLMVFQAAYSTAVAAREIDEATPRIELNPSEYVPLAVGNQWTYHHRYGNYSYLEGGRALNPEARMLFEVPGYSYPPDSLLWVDRALTIEITHTETIEGLEYFVFSRADYDWPPIPTLFWAGQKVRLSDEGVLLFRWNGQDVPLYALNPQLSGRYSIPAYPIREDIVAKLGIWRRGIDERQRRIVFGFYYPEIHFDLLDGSGSGIVFTSGYGLGYFELYYKQNEFISEEFIFLEPILFFHNTLDPISAIISGEAVSYEQARRGNTHIQPSSWGQLKRAFRPR